MADEPAKQQAAEQARPAIDPRKLEHGTAAEVEASDLNPEDTQFPRNLDIRIVADGNRVGVFDAKGHQIGFIKSIKWELDANSRNGEPICKIELYKVPISIVYRGAKVEYKSAWAVIRSRTPLARPIEPEQPAKEEAADGAAASDTQAAE